jgi:guanosine-3',5'-bis(diphosphate) 3'-pyrophosphohydrolase
MKKGELIEHAKQCYDVDQVKKLEQAIAFASAAHAGQKRLSGEPYIIHPLITADTLISWGMDIDSAIAGLLHDTVEDAGAELGQIESLFGHNVAILVDGVTKVSQASSEMKKFETYLPKTKDNLSKLLIAIGQDVRVVIIKLADRLHNLSTLKYLPVEKQRKIARESLEVFGPMADKLGMGRVRMQIEELAFSFLDPVEYKKMKVLMKKRLGKSTRKLGKIRTEVDIALKQQNINADINGRVKSIYSLHKKLAKVNGNIDDIYDLMALRIVVEKKEECYIVLGILHSLYKPMVSRIKDYISTPKPNGYQSLHTTVMTPAEQIVEFQIRTEKMHEFAERGLAASFHYHDQKITKDYIEGKGGSALPNHLHWISELQEVVGKLKEGEEISKDQLYIDLFGDRIFVHSPKGDIYDLPEGALPLDFAYLVHSDVGRNAYSFRVNGKIHAFDKPLKNGDIIEVVTKKTSQPKQSWRQLVTTTHARNKLQAQLRQSSVAGMISSATSILRRKTY